ncbi:hypothetical protein L195_g040497, partial [Trifolium pratense]
MENTFDKISTVNQILDLLSVLGYVDTTNSDAPPHQKITDGLSWIIATLNPNIMHVYHHENTIEFEQEDQLKTTSINDNLDELNHRKMNVVEKLDELRSRIDKEGADSAVQKLYTLMKSLK